jgi:lipopolysaccharide transport protein LptA
MIWQKKVRLLVAAFGIGCAIFVYFAIGTRQKSGAPPLLQRLDPTAIVESTTGFVQQDRGAKQDYHISFDRQLTYEGGSTKMFGVRIAVDKKDGRDFVVSAKEALANGVNQQDLRLTGDVKLTASDGFELTTDEAVFNQVDGVLRASGKVMFRKGGMNGWGTGMTYDKNNDVLTLAADAHVEEHDSGGNVTLDADAGSATLDRLQDVLQLGGHAIVMREEQVTEGASIRATLSPDDSFVTAMQASGNARVEGGSGSLNSMSAGDIDLRYTSDGKALQRVILTGKGAIALKGPSDTAGRQLLGEALDLTLAPDGAVTSATGRDNVSLIMPATADSAARGVRAKALDATGEEGKGLTDARFTDDVIYREEARAGSGPRTVHSRALSMGLTDVGVSRATFSGGITFEEQGLKAGAANADYQPGDGLLQLSGSNGGRAPCVADDQIRIEGQNIKVILEGRRMTATGSVKTTLHPAPAGGGVCAVEAKPAQSAEGAAKLPGLLKQDQPANVNADSLDYQGAEGNAVYTGAATLWQGDTVIRGDVLTIDQGKADFVALGSPANMARSAIALDPGTAPAQGRAVEIRYEDSRRVVTYGSPAAAGAADATPPSGVRGSRAGSSTAPGAGAAAGSGRAAAGATGDTAVVQGRGSRGAPPAGGAGAASAPRPPMPQALFTGTQGVLTADRIEVVLAETGSGLSRLEGYTNVSLVLGNTPSDRRTATGARLTYHAQDEQYDMTGTALAPLTLAEACREITGKTLTFYKSTDRIIVDGARETRTNTKSGSGAACSQPPAGTAPAATPAPR